MGILQLDIRNQEAKSFYLTSLSSPTKYHQPTQHLNPTPIQNVYLDLLYARKPQRSRSAASSTISSIVKGEGGAAGKTKCIECDGYECCCIPIPCTVMYGGVGVKVQRRGVGEKEMREERT